MSQEQQYLDLLKRIMETGNDKEDRTGTGTRSVFGATMRFDLRQGFPLYTTKKVHLRSIIHELLWFLKGETNIEYLKENNVKIWDEWADEKGDLGPVYGKQWVDWVDYQLVHHKADHSTISALDTKGYQGGEPVVDTECNLYRRSTNQIQKVMDMLKNDPDSRRIYVSAINVGELDQMALEPCHNYFQFYTRKLNNLERSHLYQQKNARPGVGWFTLLDANTGDVSDPVKFNKEMDEAGIPQRALSCFFLMRSNDCFLGNPFNVASYALLTHMMAQQLNMQVGELVYQGVDAHIYSNHFEQVKTQLERKPYPFPWLKINCHPDSIFDYKFEDFELFGYESHPAIKAPVAI